MSDLPRENRRDGIVRLIKRMKEIWSNPRDIEEAEWYLLLAFFIMIWMWQFLNIVLKPKGDRIGVSNLIS